jgi:hypothetical protein
MRAPAGPAVPRLHRLAALVAGLAVAGLLLSSAPVALAATAPKTSTPSSSSPSKSTRPKPTAAQKKAEAAFQKCLSSHGVTLPSRPTGGGSGFPPSGGTPGGTFRHGSYPGGPGGGGASTKFSKAFAACQKLAPKGFGGGFRGGPGGSFKPTAAEQQALTTYEQCMSSHGVQIAASSTFQTIQSLIKADPAAAAANKQCESDLQGAFHRPGSSTSSPSG